MLPGLASRRVAGFGNRAIRVQPQLEIIPDLWKTSRSSPFHTSTVHLEDKKLSFRGQLYESTAQRLQRERAQEQRHINAQQKVEGYSSTSRSIALSFSE